LLVNGPPLIHLDHRIPFVRATLSGPVDEAAAILRGAEERCGLRLSRTAKGDGEAGDDAWYLAHVWPFLSETHLVVSGEDLQMTGCLLTGADGLDYTTTWRHWGSLVADWANLHWIERPAGLGTTKWTRAARPWEYLDFYSNEHLSYLIAGYDIWLKKLNAVLSHNAAA
jgi:hypothetical protein